MIDGFNHLFAFYADTGCLYNLQTGRENSAFCLVPGTGDLVSYGPFHGEVTNVVTADGNCRAALIDQLTGNFANVELDSYDREVVLTTQLHPVPCI